MLQVGIFGFLTILVMLLFAVAIIASAIIAPTNKVVAEAQKWQTLIGATIGFSGVITALLLNSNLQEVSKAQTEMRQILSLNNALLAELHNHLRMVEIGSDYVLKRIAQKGLATEKFDKEECKGVASLAARINPYDLPWLYPEARKELLRFPPEVYEVFVSGYNTASLQMLAFKKWVTQKACEDGELKEEIEQLQFGHQRVVDELRKVEREMKATRKLLLSR